MAMSQSKGYVRRAIKASNQSTRFGVVTRAQKRKVSLAWGQRVCTYLRGGRLFLLQSDFYSWVRDSAARLLKIRLGADTDDDA